MTTILVQRLKLLGDGIIQQELRYRKQIARQLHTQYVEGIYRPRHCTVTLKCRLRVTQGHSRSLETEPVDRSYTTDY